MVSYNPEKYRLGSLCKRLHDFDGTGRSLRMIVNNGCYECQQLNIQKSRKNNREQYNAQARGYYAKDPQNHLARDKAYHAKNPGKKKELFANWYERHREENTTRCNRYRQTEKGKQVIKVVNQRRKARMRSQRGAEKVELIQIQKLYQTCNNECLYCGSKENLTLDHFIPLALGGKHCITNLIVPCVSCNSSKKTSPALEWYSSRSYWSQERWERILEILKSSS